MLKVLEHTCRANSQPLIHYCHSAQAKCKSFHTMGLCITYHDAIIPISTSFFKEHLSTTVGSHLRSAAWLDKTHESSRFCECLAYIHSISNYFSILFFLKVKLERSFVLTEN